LLTCTLALVACAAPSGDAQTLSETTPPEVAARVDAYFAGEGGEKGRYEFRQVKETRAMATLRLRQAGVATALFVLLAPGFVALFLSPHEEVAAEDEEALSPRDGTDLKKRSLAYDSSFAEDDSPRDPPVTLDSPPKKAGKGKCKAGKGSKSGKVGDKGAERGEDDNQKARRKDGGRAYAAPVPGWGPAVAARGLLRLVAFFVLYRLMSGNGAGGYYGPAPIVGGLGLGLGQLSNLPQHAADIQARHSGDAGPYHRGMYLEGELKIFRSLNALESTLGFVLLAPGYVLQLPYPVFPRWAVGGSDVRPVAVLQTGLHAIVYFFAHRLVARSNQGESYWQVVADGGEFVARPVEATWVTPH
jgi:hypothetical protein